MKYATEMGSRAMIKIPSLITMGSRVQKLITGIRRQHGGHISLFSFYQNKEHRLRMADQRSKKYLLSVLHSALKIMCYFEVIF